MRATTILNVLEQLETDRWRQLHINSKQNADAGPVPRSDRRAAASQFPGLSGGWLPPRSEAETLRERRSQVSPVHRARAVALLAMSLDGKSLADCERAFRLSRERCRQLQNLAADLLWKEALLAGQAAPERRYFDVRARRAHKAFWHWQIAREFVREQQRRQAAHRSRLDRVLGGARITATAVVATASPKDQASQRTDRWATDKTCNP